MVERLVEWCARNRFLVFTGTVILTVWGVWAMRSIPVDAVPDISDVQVIVSTALILGGVILMAADFGPALAPELKLFTYFGAWMLLAGSVIAALVLAPALRQRLTWEGLG